MRRVSPSRLLERLSTDHLLANSVYLMANTIAMAGLGFVFWFLVAKLFDPGDVGIGTTLISASGLIGLASLLGFDNSFIRYLPTSLRRNGHINTGLLFVLGASLVLALGYVVVTPSFTPKLAFLQDRPVYAVLFLLLTAATALNQVTDSIFIAYRGARFNLLLDGGLQSLSKIGLAFVFAGAGAFGVFASAGTAALLAVLGSLLVLWRRFGFRLRPTVDRAVLRQIGEFTGGSYVATLLNLSPVMLLPIIVLNRLGSASAGYFYIAFMIANVVFTAAYSVSLSLFAETSYGERTTRELARRGLGALLALVVPAALVLSLGSHLILLPFGRDYSDHAATALAVLGLSAPVVAGADLCGALLRARGAVAGIIRLTAIYAVSVIGFASWWGGSGLDGIALGWLAGNAVAVLAGCLLLAADVRDRSEAPYVGSHRTRSASDVPVAAPGAGVVAGHVEVGDGAGHLEVGGDLRVGLDEASHQR